MTPKHSFSAPRTCLRGQALLGAMLLLGGVAVPLTADTWQRIPDVPGARTSHSAVWTGSEVILWGGGIDGQFLNTGARFSPTTTNWQVTSVSNAPSPRWFHAAVWTGTDMIVWGGRASFDAVSHAPLGARYSPRTDRWTPLPTQGAPTPRSQFAAVWTGTEFIVWGGVTDNGTLLNDGARFNPTNNTWRPLPPSGLEPRMEPSYVWTGSELIVQGGLSFADGGRTFASGARYQPKTDSWIPLPLADGPGSRAEHTLVWTGSKVLAWGGRTLPGGQALSTGAAFDPVANAWSPLPVAQAPGARMLHAAVWTGSEMIIWGGQADAAGTLLNTGGRYSPQLDAWTPTTLVNAPGRRMFWRPDLGLWTGSRMVIAAGSDYPASLASAHLYDPTNTTTPPPIASTYDLSADFTLAANPSGPWSYGRLSALDAPLELLPLQRTFGAENGVPIGLWYSEPVHKPFVAKVLGPGTAVSTYFNAPAGTVYFGANPFTAQPEFAAIRFTLPAGAGGTYRLETSVRALFDSVRSADADFHVLRNGAELFERLVPANGTGGYTNILVLQPGDRIDFAAGRGSGNDNTGLKIQATLTRLTNAPPPPPPPPETNCAPAPFGLAAWWPAERNPNDVAGTHRGILLGNAGYASGKVGTAFAFPGGDSGIRIPASADLDVGAGPGLTIEGWIRPDDLSVRSPLVEWNRGGPGVVTWGLHLYVLMPQEFGLGAGNLVANLTDTSGASRFITAPGGTIAANVWQHVALTYDRASGIARLYCQGTLVSEAALGSFTPDTRPDLYLGRRPAGDGPLSYRGRMDELSVYRRALNAAEIASIATAGAAGKCRIPSSLDDLIALVASLPSEFDTQPLLSSLASVRSAIERGNLRSALHQLAAFQNKARAQLGAVRPDLSAQVIAQAQLLIETLDPTGARRADLLVLAGRPMRIERILRDGTRARLLGFAPPGIACCIQGSADLRNWQHAGWADEIDDGVFEWIDDGTAPVVRFFRLLEP